MIWGGLVVVMSIFVLLATHSGGSPTNERFAYTTVRGNLYTNLISLPIARPP